MKKFFVLGLVFILAGAYFTFRTKNPPLSSLAQVTRNLDGAENAVETRNARALKSFLTDDFRAGDTDRQSFNTMMGASFLQWRDVQLSRSGEKIEIDGNSAVARGKFRLSHRAQEGAPMETQSGDYTLQLRREEGKWKVVSASGVEAIR